VIGSTPLVVIDACVLANFSLCDILLRLAEPPRLFEPRWSEQIIRETTRTLEVKLAWPSSLTARLETELRAHFSEAWIGDYESLIPRMMNDEKDRHVLAAAVRCRSMRDLLDILSATVPDFVALVARPESGR
jgi:hypothetical protein